MFDEKIKTEKAMFIQSLVAAAFILVGYAGIVDHENPEIVSSHIQTPYGEKFDTDAIDVVDNHDRRSELLVEADDDSLDVKQLEHIKLKCVQQIGLIILMLKQSSRC